MICINLAVRDPRGPANMRDGYFRLQDVQSCRILEKLNNARGPPSSAWNVVVQLVFVTCLAVFVTPKNVTITLDPPLIAVTSGPTATTH